MILSGKVSIIRTFVDHNLIYQLKKDKKLSNVIEGVEEDNHQGHDHHHGEHGHKDILEAIQEDSWMKDKSSSTEKTPVGVQSENASISITPADSVDSVSDKDAETPMKTPDSKPKSKSKS